MTSADHATARRIATAFVTARRGATALPAYPGAVPATLDAAYAVQDAAIGLDGGAVAGWKVGRILAPASDAYGSDRLAGPIFTRHVWFHRPGIAMPVFAGGFGAVEAEFIYRLRAADPARTSYTLDEAAAQVDAVYVGLEIASSPLATINALGPAVTVSDFGNNNGLVIGPRIDDWRDAGLDDWAVAVEIDGAGVGQGTGASFPDGTIGSIRFLLELLARRGIAVPEGTLVSTGAVSGVHEIAAGQHAVARFADRFMLDCTILEARADPD